MTQQTWMPSADTPNSRIVGRFVDVEDEWTDKDGQRQKRQIVVLEHKVPGSADVSASIVKPFNRAELIKRFPEAWRIYEATKAKQATEPDPIPTAVEHGLKGTPIEELDFIGKDRLAGLKLMGFLLVEQLVNMSDAIAQNVSGGKMMRKKAAEYLAEKKARTEGA